MEKIVQPSKQIDICVLHKRLSFVKVAPDTHWPNMEVLILVVSDQKKAVSSTIGMQTSVETSSLIQVATLKDSCVKVSLQE